MTPTASAGVGQAVRLALGTASALGIARFAYGLLLPAMRDDLHWTLADAGVMSAANGFGYLLGALLAAALIRRLGAATAFRAGMALTAGSLSATAAAGDHLLLACRALSGATGAVVFIAGGVIATQAATRADSAMPITVYFAGTGLGILASGVTVPLLGAHWRLAWLVLGIAAALATGASWTAAGPGGVPRAGAGRARLRPLLAAALAYLLFATGYIAYITFLSAYLTDRHASVAQVVLTWTVLGSAVTAAPVLWSRPIADWPGSRALATLLAVLGGGAALALVSSAPAVVLLSALVYGATFMGVPAAVTALVGTHTSTVDRAATLAALTAVFAAGQTAGPWLAGLVADRTSTAAPLAWTAVLCAAGAAVALVGRSAAPAPDHTSPTHGVRA
ncbi:YbfB/YjiJ family MFS transporter [Micromonospora auratinigra]|uniref:Predicted arabinose efflux permease, MFS family n=1 Tax=Micromonospora auratinigra TaxID=261654 RepID=A0A1A9A5K2_9ACTN|nr:YbfB/YjiJ family MFS transporter [Micromonospora auratinigra]SBT51384.1 Predicted arabinose efflux permease, MFS family [Micromonospora auratinigra]